MNPRVGVKMKYLRLSPFMPSKINLVLGLKITIVVATALSFFYQDLATIANDALQSKFMSHIIAILFLFSYLIYRKRKMIRASVLFELSQSHRKTCILNLQPP